MEKLQAAIERARAKRDDSPIPRRERAERAALDGNWDRIPEMEVDKAKLLKNLVFVDANGPEASAHDILRTKVLQLCRENNWRRVVVTSPTKACGKTTTVANLATSFARQADRKTLVFDCDFRRPSMAEKFGQTSGQSFSEVLDGEIDFAEQARRISSNVAVAVNFAPATNPSKLIMQDRTSEMLDAIEARYKPDLMIFDVPPILGTDDTLAFLKNVDCALLVAAAEKTTINEVDNCEKELAEQTSVMGTVLNMCHFTEDAYGYGYD